LFLGIENEDHIIWAVSSSGKLSITSALSIIQEGITEDKDPIWRFIWLLQASQRVRFFLSPAADDRLMTTLMYFEIVQGLGLFGSSLFLLTIKQASLLFL